jgi:membrane protein DedA with SNARE-associated domain/membrane-associated phospholipid phosphatase
MDQITIYMNQYGYIVLFVALLLELLALPLPGEVIMSYAGFLVFQGHMNWPLSILMAGLGSSIGMTIAYWIGFKLGTPFFNKYGHRFFMGPERIEKTTKWFSAYGNKLIFIAYFIPGIRHITGYFSGITRLTFRTYALYAYSGAFVWVGTFITLGKILGPQWQHFHNSIKKYLIIGSIVVAIILVVYYVFKKYKEQLKDVTVYTLNWVMHVFHTRKRAGFFITVTALFTLGLIVLMIGMIQDFVSNEFLDFNQLVSILIPLIFNEDWTMAMHVFALMGSRGVLSVLIVLTLLLILMKGRDKTIELLALAVTVYGGELYQETLSRIFTHLSPVDNSLVEQLIYSFPSEEALMTFVIYGFGVFIFVRHSKRIWIHTFVPFVSIIILILIAVSRLFFEVQYPSDVAAGYVFGGVWLGLNILLLEIFRLFRSVDV